jgi:hypothetical protein
MFHGHVKPSAYRTNDRGAEKSRERLGRERGAHRDDAQVRSLPLSNSLGDGESHVALNVPLVDFVENDDGDALESWRCEKSALDYALGDEPNARAFARDFLEMNAVSDRPSDRFSELFSHAPGTEPGREATRLHDEDLSTRGKASF